MTGFIHQEHDRILDAQVEASALLKTLTSKQDQAIRLAAKHMTNDEIATEMNLHRRTVEEHLIAARRKLHANTRLEAVRKFIVLSDLCGEDTRGFIRVDLTTEDMEKILQDLSFERATQLLASPKFEQFMREFRSTGPKAWNAKYGRWWRVLAILVVTVLVMVFFSGSIFVAKSLDTIFAN